MKHEEEPLDDYNKRMKEYITDLVKQEIVGLGEEKKRDYKKEYAKYGSSTKAKKYRAELNKYNRQKGTYGNGDGKDASHKGGKIVGFEAQSKNRGRAEKSRLKKESMIVENPIVAATVMNMSRMKLQNPKTGRKISAVTPLKNKEHPLHQKAKSIFQKIKDKLKKKDVKPAPKPQSKSDADFYKKQFTGEGISDKMSKIMSKLAKSLNIKSVVDMHTGKGSLSYFLDDEREALKLQKFLQKSFKRVRKINLDKEEGDTANFVVAADMLGLESINESEQDKIKQFLMKKGDNEKDATEKLKYYDMVSKMYKGANSTKKAEIMSSLWANENVAPNHDGKSAPYGSGYEEMDEVRKMSDRELKDYLLYMKKYKPDVWNHMKKNKDLKKMIRKLKVESVNEGVSKSQAQEIMNQLGGRKFEMLMGVKSKGIGKDGLILHIGRNPKRVSHIIIDLDRGRDLYNLTFGKIVKYQFKVIKKLKGIYVDQLHDMIEKYTGNLTTFRPRR